MCRRGGPRKTKGHKKEKKKERMYNLEVWADQVCLCQVSHQLDVTSSAVGDLPVLWRRSTHPNRLPGPQGQVYLFILDLAT